VRRRRSPASLAAVGRPRLRLHALLSQILVALTIEIDNTYAHGVATEQLVEGALGDDFSVIDDGHSVADLLDLAQQMRVEEDRRAALAKRADDLAHVVTADGIERAGGFVENDEVGRAEERDAESESLLHSL